MGEEHITRILKMLEEGKVSAKEAEALIAALRADSKGASAAQKGESPKTPGADAEAGSGAGSSRGAESGAKSFEFQWGHRRSFPVDLGALGKQISDAVRRLDPDRIVRDARMGGRRWQERMKEWARAWQDGVEMPPVNPLGLPTARTTESRTIDIAPGATLQVENPLGPVAVSGGSDVLTLEIVKEAWAVEEAEATARLEHASVVVDVASDEHPADAGRQSKPSVCIRAEADESWREGLVHLILRVPPGVTLRAATTFGDVRVLGAALSAEIQSLSGGVTAEDVAGDLRVEAVSGNISATSIAGALEVASKSGAVIVDRIERGGAIASVSGDVHVSHVEGGRLEAKSVSGDVVAEHVGITAPLDVTIESVSGDAKLSHAAGNITLKTVSGDGSAERLDVTSFAGQAVSGDLVVSLDAPLNGRVVANTVSGDVTLRIPSGSNFRYSLQTRSGDMRSEHSAPDVVRSETSETGTVGTGAGSVEVQTLSGDIRIGVRE